MRKTLVYITLILFSATVAVTMCSGDGNGGGGVVAVDGQEEYDSDDMKLLALLYDDGTPNPYTVHFDSMPPGGRKLRVNPPGRLGRVFNDSNYLHLHEAELLGIAPIDSLPDAWSLRRDIVKIESCREYFVDELIHSLPYLVPEAATLLRDLGQAFNDTLAARGGGDYRLKVTSVLRTRSSVNGLRRRNRNAVSTSAHLYATTFDISYLKFICDSVTVPRTQEDLKNLLGEILYDFRNRGRCYVKYERKQSCYHVTVRSTTPGASDTSDLAQN